MKFVKSIHPFSILLKYFHKSYLHLLLFVHLDPMDLLHQLLMLRDLLKKILCRFKIKMIYPFLLYLLHNQILHFQILIFSYLVLTISLKFPIIIPRNDLYFVFLRHIFYYYFTIIYICDIMKTIRI